MKKLSFLLISLLLALLVLTGCGQETQESVIEENSLEAESTSANEVDDKISLYPLTFIDGADREVVLESEPMKIVSIAPSVTETLFAIGAGDKLVGRTDYCLYPEAALGVESIGTLREPNIEAIAALNPDVVIAATHFKEEVLTQLESLNIKVIMLTAQESFDGVYETTLNAGILTNHQADAQALVEEMKAEVKVIEEKVAGVTPKSVYYVVGYGESDYTATGDTFINDMLTMAGGDNIAKDGESWSYSLEKLLEHNPEIILVSDKYDSLAGFTSHENYQALSAVQEGKVLEIDSDLLSIQGPRLAMGLKAIAERLHPELF